MRAARRPLSHWTPMLGLLWACSQKTSDTAGTADTADTAGTGCDNELGVLSAVVTRALGGEPPAGTRLYAEDNENIVTETILDEYHTAELSLAAGTYRVWAANDSAYVQSIPTDAELTACQTTVVELELLDYDG